MNPATSLLAEIAETVGTPFYCYDAAELRQRVTSVRAALPDASFYYSMKANPNLSVVKTLTEAGVGCEVCSLGELMVALAAGVSPAEIIFVGPGKGAAEIARAIDSGVAVIVAESLAELALIQDQARSRGMEQDVALRINPAFSTSGARLAMSGRPTQFGIDSVDLDAALTLVSSLPNLRLHGLHVYMGTRILDHTAIADNTRRILQMADSVALRTGRPLDLVDVGGGFGVAYFGTETDLDLQALSDDLSSEITIRRREQPGTRIAFELGRYLTAPAGIFVTKVRAVKGAKGRRFAVCDGGSNCHSAAAGFGSALRKNFQMSVVGKANDPTSKWTVTGPLCTPTDAIGMDVDLPELAVGDLVCIHRSGAYGPSASPVHFLGFGHPAEVMIDGTDAWIVRAADTLERLVHVQSPIAISLAGPAPSRAQEERVHEPA